MGGGGVRSEQRAYRMGGLGPSRWGATGGSVEAGERGEETHMSEVRNVKDWICLATKQGHTLSPPSSFLSEHQLHQEKKGGQDPHFLSISAAENKRRQKHIKAFSH